MMENTTVHGRKVIRPKKTYKVIKRRFWLFTITILIIGALLGCLIVNLISNREMKEVEAAKQTISEKNEYILQHVNQYGAYDGKVFTEEVSRDWSGDELKFTPLDCGLDAETQEFTFYLCKAYDLDWTLVMGLMQKESSFKSDIISASNDYGLMQINKCNHSWLKETLGVTDFLDKEQNIRAGVFVLRKLFEEYKEPKMVLMAYNMGATGAAKLWDKGIYTTSYVDDILKNQRVFDKQLEERNGDK